MLGTIVPICFCWAFRRPIMNITKTINIIQNSATFIIIFVKMMRKTKYMKSQHN